MPSDHELQLLSDAARSPELSKSVNTYLELRRLFADSSEAGRAAFQKRFSRYYKLQSRFLTEEWQACYFDLLFGFNQTSVAEPYHSLLLKLNKFSRRGGAQVFEFSFVSKLVAFHDEMRPIYDRNVREFFGLGPPDFGPDEFRITGFVNNLNEIARRYGAWQQQKKFAEVLDELRSRHTGLAACHSVRLCDFLVHKAVESWKRGQRPTQE